MLSILISASKKNENNNLLIAVYSAIRKNNTQNKHEQREARNIRGARKIFIIKKRVD